MLLKLCITQAITKTSPVSHLNPQPVTICSDWGANTHAATTSRNYFISASPKSKHVALYCCKWSFAGDNLSAESFFGSLHLARKIKAACVCVLLNDRERRLQSSSFIMQRSRRNTYKPGTSTRSLSLSLSASHYRRQTTLIQIIQLCPVRQREPCAIVPEPFASRKFASCPQQHTFSLE